LNQSIDSVEMVGSVMDELYGGVPDYYPQVKFDFDQDPDPIKRRKKNIKKARKLLRPSKAWWSVWPLNFSRFNDAGQCAVTGIRLAALGPQAFNKPLLDPDTLKPLDNGTTLAQQFFIDPVTGNKTPFTAFSNVDQGVPLRSSYCPELLQLYWLFTQWRHQQHLDNQGQFSVFLWKRKKIKMVPITEKPKKSSKPSFAMALEPFFQLIQEHTHTGEAHIIQRRNPFTEEVDSVSIDLDLRVMRYIDEQNGQAQPSSVEATSVGQSGV